MQHQQELEKRPHGIKVTSKDLTKSGGPRASPEEIDILEIFVKKSRAIGLGQRLLWHVNKFNRRFKLPCIPDVKEFYMQVVSAS